MANYTDLKAWPNQATWLYSLGGQIDVAGLNVGDSIQITGGTGWTAGYYTINQKLTGYSTVDGSKNMILIDRNASAAGTTGGIGNAPATLPYFTPFAVYNNANVLRSTNSEAVASALGYSAIYLKRDSELRFKSDVTGLTQFRFWAYHNGAGIKVRIGGELVLSVGLSTYGAANAWGEFTIPVTTSKTGVQEISITVRGEVYIHTIAGYGCPLSPVSGARAFAKQVVFDGDSITSATNSGSATGHVERLAQLLNWGVFNGGNAGDTIAQVNASRTNYTGATPTPERVVVLAGINDAANPIATIKSDYVALISNLVASAIPQIQFIKLLPTAQVTDTKRGEMNTALAEAIAENGSSKLSLIDISANFVPGTHTGDGIHPNDAGYALLASNYIAATATRQFARLNLNGGFKSLSGGLIS